MNENIYVCELAERASLEHLHIFFSLYTLYYAQYIKKQLKFVGAPVYGGPWAAAHSALSYKSGPG